MAAGHHNGFNPFRDAHGRWATPGGHASEIHGPPTTMNDAIRSAAGRGASSLGDYDSSISAAMLAAVDRRAPGATAFIGREIATPLRALIGEASSPQSTHAIMTLLAGKAQADGADKEQIHALMLRLIGQELPKNVTAHDLIDMMDKIEQAPSDGVRAGRELLGAALAIKAGQGDAAAAVLGGPGSAAWTTTRQQLLDHAGPARQGIDYARRAAQIGVDLTAPLSARDRAAAIYNARQNEIGGKYDHVVMSEIYAIDRPYLMRLAYDGSSWGAHVGNYLHAMNDL
jgi:hypothetical protein